MHRAKDHRFVEESCTEWLAVVKIQVSRTKKLHHTCAICFKFSLD